MGFNLKTVGLSHVIIIFVLFSSIFYFFTRGLNRFEIFFFSNTVAEVSQASVSVNSGQASNKTNEMVVPSVSVSAVSVDESNRWLAKPDEVQQLALWRESRGWYDPNGHPKDDYKSYSIENLERLANNGDLKAMQFLIVKTPMEQREALLKKAVVYGSTFALRQLVYLVEPTPSELSSLSQEQRKALAMNAAMYVAFAELRNDLDNSPRQEYPSLEKEYSVIFSNEDMLLIKERADTMYKEMEAKRIEIGLGPFDNTMPPTVIKYYRAMGFLQ